MAPDASLSSKSDAPYAYFAFSFPSLSLFSSSTFFFLNRGLEGVPPLNPVDITVASQFFVGRNTSGILKSQII